MNRAGLYAPMASRPLINCWVAKHKVVKMSLFSPGTAELPDKVNLVKYLLRSKPFRLILITVDFMEIFVGAFQRALDKGSPPFYWKSIKT